MAIALSNCLRNQQENVHPDCKPAGCGLSDDRISSQSMYNPEQFSLLKHP